MDILHLKEKVISLVAYMKDVGYTSQYIWYINHLTTWVVSNSMCYEWKNYADIEHTLAKLWSSYRHSMYYQKYLIDYLTSFGKQDIALEEVTEDFGKYYKAYLKKCKNFGASQTNKCMCWLNRLLYLAVDRDIIRVNPCEDLEYEPKPEAKHKYISREEFKRILATPMYDKRQELARRAFIFSTLTGLAYVDIKLLHPHHIGRNAEGKRYIRINRKKTNVEAFVPLHPIAEQILSLYNTTDDEQPVFPLPSRDALWFDIHEMGVIIGMPVLLLQTSHHQTCHLCKVRFRQHLQSKLPDNLRQISEELPRMYWRSGS